MGRDFAVVWICRPEEWEAAQAEGREPEGVPWPAEDVTRHGACGRGDMTDNDEASEPEETELDRAVHHRHLPGAEEPAEAMSGEGQQDVPPFPPPIKRIGNTPDPPPPPKK